MLKLDKTPYTMSMEDLQKYTGRYIFVVGKQFQKRNTKFDPELRPVSIGSVHIEMQYLSYESAKGGVRKPMGMLRYYESEFYDEKNRLTTYYPQYYPVDEKGYIEVNNPEISFFLDNHPANQRVIEDKSHPNHRPGTQAIFGTFQKDKREKEALEILELTNELTVKLLDKSVYDYDNLKALAQMIVRQANGYGAVHKLTNVDFMNEIGLRVELGRLVKAYPGMLQALMNSKNTEWQLEINAFIELELVKMDKSEWVIVEEGKPRQGLVKVAGGDDPKKVLADWFKNNDKKNSKYNYLKAKQAEIAKRRMKEPVA